MIGPEKHKFKNGQLAMPLKRTYSTSTSIVPYAGQQQKKRNLSKRSGLRRKTKYGLTVGKPMPFPTRMLAKLKYVETITATNPLASIAQFWMRANSIYDPNPAVGGHQPYGHDTYATIYNQYTVLSSKCTFLPSQSSAVLNGFTWGGGISDDTSTTANQDTWMERPTYKREMSMQNAGPGAKPLTIYWDRFKRFPSPDTWTQLSSNFGANPAEQEYFDIIVQMNSQGVAVPNMFFVVEIEYTCEFYELKDLGNS